MIDPTDCCPLCHNVLDEVTDLDAASTYPDISEKFKKITLFKRIIMFSGIVAIALCGFVDVQLNGRPNWSIIVSLVVLYAIFELFMFLNPESGYQKRIFFTIIGGFLVVVAIDLLTGFHGWSLNFVFPGAIFLMNVGLLMLMVINRRNWQSYMIHQIGVILVGIIPIILIRLGIVTYTKLSELAFLSSVLVFVGTFIFGGRVARMELKRRFHI